ncbi:MAG: AAA family ATPase [Chloroflexi bacterium]|nr:AAA family ATPase [Chloroflexota bacterium]
MAASTLQTDSPVTRLQVRLDGVRQTPTGWEARCPTHDDRHASLSLAEGDDGRALLCCHAGCSAEQIVGALGLSLADLFPERPNGVARGADRKQIIATYAYRTADGALSFEVVRFEPKDFRQRRPAKAGGWEWRAGDLGLVYRLPEVLAADPSATVFVVEGEKDVDNLAALGLAATCNPGGAGKWVDRHSDYLRGRRAVVLPDNDKPGRKHAQQVARSLHGVAASIKVLELPGLPPKGDVSDWIAAGGTAETLAELVQAARRWSPATEQPGNGLVTFTAADLLSMELPEPKWAVAGVIPEGLTVLGGKPKLGKSWFGLGLGVAVASGGRAVGKIEVAAGDVLVLALEDTKRRLQSRLAQMLGDAAAPSRLVLATAWPRLDAGGLELLDAWLHDHPGARLILIDTLARVRPTRARNGDLYTEDYAVGMSLKALADRCAVAIVLIHHLRKMGADDPVDAVSGTLGLTGAADAVLVMKRERGHHDAALFITGRDLEEQELALKWDPAICGWVLVGDAAEQRISQERAAVIEVLHDAGRPLSPTAVAPLLSKNLSTTKGLLWRMSQDGQLLVDGRGRYAPAVSNQPHQPDQPRQPGKPHQPMAPGSRLTRGDSVDAVCLVDPEAESGVRSHAEAALRAEVMTDAVDD